MRVEAATAHAYLTIRPIGLNGVTTGGVVTFRDDDQRIPCCKAVKILIHVLLAGNLLWAFGLEIQ